MLYITGIHALNLPCSLDTCGDWHMSSLNWNKLTLKESDYSIWKDYGIEQGHKIPEHTKLFAAANHIRAILDLLEDGRFDLAQGMNKNFIGNDKYNEEVFEQVSKLRQSPAWKGICDFMHKEYGRKWRIWSGKTSRKKMLP